MAPFIESAGQLTPPISDGEVPAVYAPQTKHLPEVLSNGKANEITNGVDAKAADDIDQYAIPLNPEFAFTPRKLKVITIGAGFSGLLIAHKFQHRFPELQDIIEHKIFEARSDVGGTWLVNTYPGVQCDVPSHIYVSLKPCKTRSRESSDRLGFSIRPKPRLGALLCQWRRD